MHGCFRILILSLTLTLSGCAAGPYRYGAAERYFTSPELAAVTQPQLERGERRPVLDGVGWVLGIPSKIILWDRRVDNHDISLETEAAIAEYLAVNELDTVKVRLNEYAPLDEWDRLVANKAVGWGWRYTAGTLSWLGYTLLPGRVFGGDHFNAFTNTINLYSDVPAIAIHEGGHAKDFARREWKGTYAVAYSLPGAPLWYEAVATKDALGYLHEHGTLREEQDAYRILYPAYGTYVGGAIGEWTPYNGLLVYAAAVVPGHILGRIKARSLRNSRPPEPRMERLPPSDFDDFTPTNSPNPDEPETEILPGPTADFPLHDSTLLP